MKQKSTPVFFPGEFHWSKRFTGYNHGVAKSRIQLNKNTFTFIFMWSILKNVPSALEKNVLSAAFRWNAVFMYIKLIWSSVQFSHSVMSDSLRPHELQYTRPPCPLLTPGVHPNPCPLRWCHPTISSSVIPFSSCLQSFPASGSFPMTQLFTSAGQSIGVSASTSVVPVNTQNWLPIGLTGWIFLHSEGLSRVFSNTTVQKHKFFSTQLSL